MAVLVVCAVALGWHAASGARVTHDLLWGRWGADAAATESFYDCLAEGVSRSMPAGSTAWVDPALEPDLYQRVTERVFGRGNVASSREESDVALTVVDRVQGACAGRDVVRIGA